MKHFWEGIFYETKINRAILVFAMTMTCWIPAFAADLVSKSDDADLNKISIAFRIGDSTLKVNGSDVTVTTPMRATAQRWSLPGHHRSIRRRGGME